MIIASIARAAKKSSDLLLIQLATDFAARTIAASLAIGSPLGKEQGELLTRLHAAVANLLGRESTAAEAPFRSALNGDPYAS